MMDEKPKGKPRLAVQESPCSVCGGAAFTWGETSRVDAGWLGFKPDGPKLFVGERVYARKCNDCGNIQLFTR